MKETKAIDDLVIKFEKARLHIQEPERVLFTSMPSKYLGKYDNGVIRGEEIPIETPNDLCWNTYRENYIRLFGTKQIHFGNLCQAGFLNQDYDLTFCFTFDYLLSQPHKIYNHDQLTLALFYGNTNLHLEETAEFEKGDEILCPFIDLKKSAGVLVYSQDAFEEIGKYSFFKQLPKKDLCKLRLKAIRIK